MYLIYILFSNGAISRTLGHETYHYVESENTVQAKEISDFVIDTLTRHKGERWVNDMYAFYEKNGYDTLEKQKSELVADQMFEVFANERAVNEFVAKDRSFAQKVLSHIRNAINDIKNIYKKLVASGNYEDIAAWQSDMEALDKLNNMMLDALAEIEHTNSQTQKNTSEEVKNSKKRNPAQSKYENDVDAVINGTYNSRSALIMGVTPQTYQDLGFSKLPIAITKNHVYSIAVTEQQAKANGRYNKNVNYHGLGAQAVKDIYENISDPIMVIASPDFQSKIQRESVHKVIAIVDLQVGGKQVIAPIEIDAEVTNGNQIIDVNLVSSYFDKSNLNKMLSEAVAQESTGGVGFYFVDKNRAKNIFKLAKVQYLGKLDSLNSNGIIHTIDEKVNRKIDDVLKSKQFIRWFGDWQNHPESASKIVNADGTPKVMYHGTQAQFTAFDKKKAKSSGYYGKGFYFTDSESHAQQYGNSMAVYLDVKNPLEQGKNHISKKQLRKFLEAVAENEDDYDIWNYGTEDISEIIESIYKDDAFAVIQDVNATAIGDFAEAIALFNKVNGTNYDGIVTPTETVVYEPTQIKSVDNIGTYDGSNDDIYFSTKRGADQKQKQLDIINETNPAPNTYSTWIRTVDDIKTLAETLEDEDWDYEEFNPDLTRTDIQNAIESGEITVYSSYPIKNGVFVSPSRMEAESYSGNGRVYEKTVDINDVAWIDPTQGQYAKVDVKFATKRLTNDSPLSYNNRAKPNPRSSINWVYEAELFSVVENKLFHQKISEINQGSKAFKKNADGEYMLPIENKIVFKNGDYGYPEITKIIEFMSESQTEISEARRVIYSVEKGESSFKASLRALENLFGQGFVYEYHSGDNRPYEWEGRIPKGRNRRAVINHYIQTQNGAGNTSSGGTNQSVIPSTKREPSISEDASDYILDTKEYQEIIKIVVQRYNLTNKKKLSPKAIDRLAGSLLAKSKSKYDKGALTERLSALFDYMANSDELVWEDVMKISAEIAHDILSKSSTLDRSMQNMVNYYQDKHIAVII